MGRYVYSLLLFLTFAGIAHAQQPMQGIVPSQGKGSVIVYPNPARNNFYVETYSSNPYKTSTISVLNILGQPIFKQQAFGEENGYIRFQVLLQGDTPKGLYFVKVDDEVSDYKIIRLKIE